MTRDEIIQAIDRDRADLLAVLEGLDETTILTRPVVEQWTVKDLLGHMAVWHAVALQAIADYRATGAPQQLELNSDASVDDYNAQEAARRRDWPLERVREEWETSYRDLLAVVASLSEADLAALLPPPWESGTTLEYLIAINSYKHDPDHLAQIRQRVSG